MSENSDNIIINSQANLWQWNGKNPYRNNPLKILGCDRQKKITPQIVKASAEKLIAKERVTEAVQKDGLSARQCRDLMLNPISRVICELMRMPPETVDPDVYNKLKAISTEHFKKQPQLPESKVVHIDWKLLAGELLQTEISTPVLENQLENIAFEAPEKVNEKNLPKMRFKQRNSIQR